MIDSDYGETFIVLVPGAVAFPLTIPSFCRFAEREREREREGGKKRETVVGL